tara:strand:- start:31 stop:570 length:540 start_codon:yes stop_codon:yes gene_type:complete
MTSANALFKVYIENMPDALNTKKDVDEYCKQFWKDNKEKDKEAKAAEKAAKAEKPKCKKGFDKDGNPKEKRAPSAYNIFVKEKYAEIKAENPNMDKTEIFAEIAKKWQESKKLNEEVNEDEVEKEEAKDEEKEQEKEEAKDEEKEEEKEAVKAPPKKKAGRKAIVKKKTDEVVEAENDE